MSAMSVKPEWFGPMVETWLPGHQWEENAHEKIVKALAQVALEHGGGIMLDVPITEPQRAQFALLKTGECLERRMNQYASHVFRRWITRPRELDVDESELPIVAAAELVPRVDLNSATKLQLVDLPTIGEVTAERIIDYRETVGPFTKVRDMQKVKGVTERMYDAVKYDVMAQAPSDPQVLHASMESFLDHPTFAKFCAIVKAGGYPEGRDGVTVEQAVLGELAIVLENVRDNGFRQVPYKHTRSSDALGEMENLAKIASLEDDLGETGGFGALLLDRNYREFVEQLIAGAETHVYLMMFFYRFLDEDTYVTDALTASLVKLHEAGGDVRILLDLDEETDPYRSRDINREIFEFLKDKGVPVRVDLPERLTHSKLILVDQKHIVVGSHNWTAGSFYQYDDTSVYLESGALGAYYVERFLDHWGAASTEFPEALGNPGDVAAIQ